MLVELWPFGRAKFGRELLPLLEQRAARRRAGVRQRARHPRQPPRRPARARRARVRARQRAPRRRARPQRSRVRAAGAHVRAAGAAPRPGPPHGLRRRGAPAPADGRREGVVVSAGGGLVGAPLLRAALGAQRILWPRTARPMRLIGGPFLPAARSGRAGRCRGHRAGRDVRPQRRRARRRSWTAPRRRSASAATTPRSSWCRRACPRWSSHTRRRRRTSSGAARGGWPGWARCGYSTRSGSRPSRSPSAIRALDGFVPAPRGSRPRRRARDHRAGCGRTTAWRPGSHEPRRPRAPPVRRPPVARAGRRRRRDAWR